MVFSNEVGVKKAYIDNPFDDDSEEPIPHANLMEALGGYESVLNSLQDTTFDPIHSGEEVIPAQLSTDVLQGILDAYRNREALVDEDDNHRQMSNFMAELTGLPTDEIDSRLESDGEDYRPSLDSKTGRKEYNDIMQELALRANEIAEVRQNVPGINPPLRSADIHDLAGPAIPTINTPDDILIDDWLTPEEQEMLLSEPMDMSWRLLKERVSPAAIRHKLEYDTKYESSPKRVKYREQLNQERRRRGIYGSGNRMDISHTQGGKLTLEGQHANRARHFKNRGTLRRVSVR